MLRRLPPDEGTASQNASLRDSADDRRDPLRPNLTAHHIVGQEQRLGPAGHEIVDDHADEIDADRVVGA